MKLVIEWVVDDLDSHAVEYKLESNYTERTRIGHILLNSCFMALKRAMNGQESRRIFNALSVTENFSSAPQKKSGFIEALKFWKG